MNSRQHIFKVLKIFEEVRYFINFIDRFSRSQKYFASQEYRQIMHGCYYSKFVGRV